MELQRNQVITTESSESDRFDEHHHIFEAFKEENEAKREKLGRALRHMLKTYEGEELDEKTLRLLQGVKTKHFEKLSMHSKMDRFF